MKDLDAQRLSAGMGCKLASAQRHLPHIIRTMGRYEILTLERVSSWLATLGHESAGFVYKKELHDGSNYEGRLDLGNRFPGDGKRFPGRGWIQLTGRDAYQAYAIYKNMTLDQVIAYLETDEGAADSAGWFWRGMPIGTATKKKPWDLNTFADVPTWRSFYETQIRVNGTSKTVGVVEGITVNLPNGWADRCARYARFWSVLE